MVEGRDVVGAVAADAEVDAGGADQRFDLRLDQARRRWWRNDGDVVGQALALRRVEDGEPLQERDGLCILAGLAGAALLVLRREAVGIDDGRAVFAPADIAAQGQGLAGFLSIAVLPRRAPETSSPALNPSRKTRPHSHSTGGVAGSPR